MKTNLLKPCEKCPFKRSSAKGWLGPWTPEEIQSIITYATHACHQTVTETVDYESSKVASFEMCAGAAIHLNNQAKLSRNITAVSYQRKLKSVEAKVKDSVFTWSSEFIKHHTL